MPKMKWSLKHDTIFGLEILSWELWKYRSGTRERGNCCEEICKILNSTKEPQFCVSQKSLRDQLKILERDCKARKGEAERGSAISPEYREIRSWKTILREETKKRLSRVKNQLSIETRSIKRYQGRR